MLLHEQRTEVVRYCRLMASTGLIKMTSGNISIRDKASGLIAVSPTSLDYDVMTPADVVVCDFEGKVVEGTRRPTSELPLHMAIYHGRPDVVAIVHTHSIYATAQGLTGAELPMVIINQAFMGGSVPVAPYRTSGTPALGEIALECLGEKKSVILQNHGLVSVGSSVGEAFAIATYVEEAAHIYLTAKMVTTNPSTLPQEEAGRIVASYMKAIGK